MSNSADELIGIIRDLIKEEIKTADSSTMCIVQSVNTDGTLNIVLPSDPDKTITNIYNCSVYKFSSGEAAILYKLRNSLNNAFVIAKPTNKQPDRIETSEAQVINNITNVTQEETQHLYRHIIYCSVSNSTRYSTAAPIRATLYTVDNNEFTTETFTNYIITNGFIPSSGIINDKNSSGIALFADTIGYSTGLYISVNSTDRSVLSRYVDISFSNDRVVQIF